MFRGLKLKLTLTNTFVVGFILLIIFSGIYIFMKNGMVEQSDRLMRTIASEDHMRPSRFFTGQRRPPLNYFFVVTDSSSKITETSPNIQYSPEELTVLVSETKRSSKEKGVIKSNNEKFRFLHTPIKSKKELTKIVFYNLQAENETIARLITTLSVIGLVALALGFFCSLFMASRALIPIKKSWDRQKAFVADASHELRTPLAVIQTNLELVMDNPKETVESQNQWLDNIHAESRIMSKLVGDLLFLARADSDGENITMEVFPLHLLLKDTLNALKPLAESKGISLEDNLESEIDYYGNESRIKQLVTILVDNAIKYNHPDGSVTVSLKSKENAVEILVTDTGVGIAKEHIAKIFERFYRIDSSRFRETGGSGLGLSIAECIVKEHSGSINVSSTPGKGSTFKVILPIRKHL